MEIDYDYLRTGTAIGFCASHELCSNYLLNLLMDLVLMRKIMHMPVSLHFTFPKCSYHVYVCAYVHMQLLSLSTNEIEQCSLISHMHTMYKVSQVIDMQA